MSLNGARKRALVVSVEDLHWIDGVSEEYFAGVVDAIADVPILLLTTYRPGYTPPWIDRSFATQIALRALTEQDSLSVVQSVQERASRLPDEQVRAVIAKAEGNPFFLEELTRALAEGESSAIPDTVQGVLAARIDRLPEAARRLLQSAAVLGREAPLKLLRAISDEPGALEANLHVLKRAELMHERSGATEPQIAFKHALTQEVAYEGLLSARTQALHEIEGRAIERLYDERLEQHYEVLAYHYAKTTNTSKALDYLELAFAKAAEKYALLEAKGYFEQAHAILLSLPETRENIRRRVLLLHKLQPVMLPLLRLAEYWALLTACQPLAETTGDAGTMGALYGVMGHCQWSFGKLDEAEALMIRAIALCEAGGLTEEEGFARCVLPWIYIHQLRQDDAIAAKASALAVIGQAFNLRWYVWALLAPAWAAIYQCRYAQAEEDALAALHAGEQHADQSVVSNSAVVLCDLYLYKGDLPRALQYAELALANTPTPFDQVMAAGQYHLVRCLLGEVEASLPQLAAVSNALRQSGFFPGEWWTLYLGEVLLQSGRAAEARDAMLAFRSAYPGHSNRIHLAYSRLVIGSAYLALGGSEHLQAAEAEFSQCLPGFESARLHKFVARCHFGLGRIRAAQGKLDEARDYFVQALERLERHGILLEPERVRAELAKLPAAHR
jgi:tetratricopeptide (TPR) repeat protein